MSRTYMPNFNTTGVRRYYTLSGWGLGDVNDTAQGMISEGYDPGTINTLVAAGATQAQLQSLWDNTQPNTPAFANAASTLIQQLTSAGMPSPSAAVQPVSPIPLPSGLPASLLTSSDYAPLPGAGAVPGIGPVTPAAPAAGSSATPAAPAGAITPTPAPAGAQIPAGSNFTYTVQWASSLANWQNPSQILSSVNSILQQHGINIVSSSIPSTIVGYATGFTIIIQTTTAFSQASDIKSICDAAVAQAGRSVTSSSLVAGGAVTSAGAAAVPGASWTSWLQNNAGLLLGVVAILVIVPPLMKKL